MSISENPLSKRLPYNTIVMSLGLGIRVIAQSIIFYIAARKLGAEYFGLFSAIQALIFLFMPFASWGSGYILIKHVSRNSREFSIQWSTSLTLTFMASAILFVFLNFILLRMYPIPTIIYISTPLILGDLFGLALVTISSQAFQSNERFFQASMTWAILSICRLACSILFLATPFTKNIENWALSYGIGGLTAGLLMILWVNLELGSPVITLAGMKQEWMQGFYFSVSVFAQGAYNNIDKTLLSKLASDSIAGVYSVSYRLLDVMFIPIQGLIFATFPRFFREGGKSLSDVKHIALLILPWAVGWGLLAWLGISVLSPLLIIMLGNDYLMVSKIIALLGPILAFRAAHYVAANALAGASFQGLRSAVQIGIATMNFALNIWWIPFLGWKGAVWSSLISDGLLALGLWLMIVWLEWRSKRVGI